MNPYQDVPTKAFWKPAIANNSMFDIDEIWGPKFKIKRSEKIVTYGSCFGCIF